MRRLMLLGTLVLTLVAAALLSAQGQPGDTCDPETVQQTLSEITTIVTQAQDEMAADGDVAAAIADLAQAEATLIELNTTCFGLVLPTPTPTPRATTYYINSAHAVNARSCPKTSCSVVTQLQPNAAISVIGTVEGDTVSGSNEWQFIVYDGEDAYVHSSLTSRQQRPTSAQVQPSGQQPISTPPPAQSQPTQAPAPGFACDCSKTCPAMVSCEEAYFQLNQCGCGRRDGDNDGVPCEEICPGG